MVESCKTFGCQNVLTPDGRIVCASCWDAKAAMCQKHGAVPCMACGEPSRTLVDKYCERCWDDEITKKTKLHEPENRFGNERRRPISLAEGPNPKDIVGAAKISLTKVPAVGMIHCAHAMMDGAYKYGEYNWRHKKVQASIFVDAAIRHGLDWFEGEEHAGDSLAHHLGHMMACCAILLDAQEHGRLIDDRPGKGKVISQLLERLQERLAKMPSKLKHDAKKEEKV